MEKIDFNTFTKIELKIGQVLKAEKIEKSDKLLKLLVDLGEKEPRQIISGISKFYNIEEITGKKAVFITNLEPRQIMGLESNGMILCVPLEETFSILSSEKKGVENGAKIS